MRAFSSPAAAAAEVVSSAMRSAPRRPCCESMSVLSSARSCASSVVSFSGAQASSISPLKKRRYCSLQVIAFMRARSTRCFSRYSASAAGFEVPIVSVPLNIMCSKKWLMPVMPGRSFTEPTLATQPAAITFGWSVRGRRRNFMPLSSVKTSGETCCAERGRATASAATAPKSARMNGSAVMPRDREG